MTKYAGLVGISALTACGSSGSATDTTVPVSQASTGFAVAGQAARGGVTFTKRGMASYFETGDFSGFVAAGPFSTEEIEYTVDSFALASNDITVAVSDDEEEVIFTIDGATYTLARYVDPEEPDDLIYVFADENGYAGVKFVAISDFVDIFIADVTLTDQTTLVLDVMGFDTDPSVIAAESGTATYLGQVSFTGERLSTVDPDNPDEGGFDGISGELTLTADFGASNISGSAVLENGSDETPLVETVTFQDAAINGNGFSGSVTSDEAFFGPGQSLGDVTFSGNFYGPNGETVAGSITGEVLINGEDPLLLLGYFGANEQPARP